MAFQTQKALDEVGDKISASEKESIENEIKALRAILDRTNAENMSDSDIDEIKAAKEKLMNTAQPVFAKMYEQAQGAAGAAGAGPDMSKMGGQQSTASGNYGDDVEIVAVIDLRGHNMTVVDMEELTDKIEKKCQDVGLAYRF